MAEISSVDNETDVAQHFVPMEPSVANETHVPQRIAQHFVPMEPSVANEMAALLGKAQSFVARESILSKSVVDAIKELITIGKKFAPKLSHAERIAKNSFSSRHQDWLEEVDDAISQADDLLDECAHHVLRYSLGLLADKESANKVRNCFSFMSSSLMWSNLTGRFKDINVKLDKAVNENLDLPGLTDGGSKERSATVQEIKDSSKIESQVVQEKDSSKIESQVFQEKDSKKDSSKIESQVVQEKDSSKIESQVVKENNDVKKVVSELLNLDHGNDLSFISLVGWGGTGKTTLARLLYKDVGVMYHFDERMWVKVSVHLDIDIILKGMLTNLTHTRAEGSDRAVILRRLQERLKGKRYLLVLDDIWEERISRLDLLKKFLRNLGDSRGSKVVITTCVENVACADESSFLYKMSLESSHYCWTLFDKIAFAEGGAKKTPLLENIGKTMVKECRGNPLYVKLIGSLMYHMKNESQWLRIKESERWMDLSRGIPNLCYDYMSSLPLKKCFQYCFIFPKGYLIQREELIQLWMAQGYTNPPEGSDSKMEDPGVQYYDTLLRRSFLQVAEDDDFDTKSCKIHDLLGGLDLSTPTSGYCKTLEDRDIRGSLGAMHLSLINCKVEFSEALRSSFSNLRTLRLENTGGMGDLLTCAEDLRVLIVVDGSIEELPNSIGMLKRLKYLDISRTKIVSLPDSISKLYNLQTLRLYDLQQSPRNFENLVSLRHLYIENFKNSAKMNLLPLKFSGMVNLSSAKASLKVFLDKECKLDNLEFGEHPSGYSGISIYHLENITTLVKASKAKLSRMARIESLKLHWSARRESGHDEDVLEGLQPHSNVKNLAIENFKGTKFPSWMASRLLVNLVKMELENCSWCEHLPPLGHLPYLRTLKIVEMDSVRSIAEEFYSFPESGNPSGTHGSFDVFPALRELTVYGMSSLEEWRGAEQLAKSSSVKAFPYLERLEVEQCPMLNSIPDMVLDYNRMYLRKLRIALCEKLTNLPKGLREVQSLEDLEILGLPFLRQFSIGCANNLKSLTIGCFSTISENGRQTQDACVSRTSLHLRGGSKGVKNLPEQLQHLTALTNLTIWGYSELEALPDWLANLHSLQILKLESCGELVSFPSAEKMQQVTSLKELDICYCPLLEDRCTRGRRPEWHKISRIPTINVNYETIQQLQRPN